LFKVFLQQNFETLKNLRKLAAGAGDAAVVNYATFSEVHRDYLSFFYLAKYKLTRQKNRLMKSQCKNANQLHLQSIPLLFL
jgi:hypothetical protein